MLASAGPGGPPPPIASQTPAALPATGPTVLKRFEHVLEQVQLIALTPDGKYLAAGCKDGTIKLWDVADGNALHTLTVGGTTKDRYEVNSLVFSPNSKWLAAGRSGGPVNVWDIQSGKEHWAIVDQNSKAVGFLPDGKSLVTPGGFGKSTKVWDVAAKSMTAEGFSFFTNTTVMVLSPDGKWAATGQGAQSDEKPEPRVTLHELPSGKLRGNLLPQTEGTEVLAMSADGKRLASVKGWASHPAKTINLWDLSTGQVKAELKGHTDKIQALAFSPDGKYLASGGWDKTVRIWDAGTGQEITSFTFEKWVTGVSFGRESKTLAVSGWMPYVTLWDLSPVLRADRR
jgi:WD40 repeat protein